MITVHHLANSRSQRVLWLLEELELAYRVTRYERDARTLSAPAALRAVHPLGKSPVIEDDGQVVAETGAIMDYVLGRYGDGRLVPRAGTPERLRYVYWMHHAEGSAMPPLLVQLIAERMTLPPTPFWLRPTAALVARGLRRTFADPRVRQNLDFQEAELGRGDWFAGDAFTAADIQMSFPIETAARSGGVNESRPRLRRFLDAIHRRPAYGRALARGGAYALASAASS